MIKDNFTLDKRFNEFINNLAQIDYVNIEEALEEFKEEKHLKNPFNKQNKILLEKFQKLKITRKELNRFIEIQCNKNVFIIETLKKRNTAYTISFIIYLISYLPFFFIKNNNPFYYYKIYNGGFYLVIFLSVIFIFFNNLNLYFINKRNIENISFYDNYSLCFHKNCLEILDIDDDRLIFDNKGNTIEIDYEEKEKVPYYYSLIPFIASLISCIILIII